MSKSLQTDFILLGKHFAEPKVASRYIVTCRPSLNQTYSSIPSTANITTINFNGIPLERYNEKKFPR